MPLSGEAVLVAWGVKTCKPSEVHAETLHTQTCLLARILSALTTSLVISPSRSLGKEMIVMQDSD